MQMTRADPRVSSRYLRILITSRITRAYRKVDARGVVLLCYRLVYNTMKTRQTNSVTKACTTKGRDAMGLQNDIVAYA